MNQLGSDPEKTGLGYEVKRGQGASHLKDTEFQGNTKGLWHCLPRHEKGKNRASGNSDLGKGPEEEYRARLTGGHHGGS